MKPHRLTALIFDVEGTLIDCIAQTLESWRATLGRHGHEFALRRLHTYAGMDSNEMLKDLSRKLPCLRSMDAITCGEDVRHGKSDPALLRASLKKLDAPAPSEVIAIGDTPYDALAAEAAGMHAVGLTSGGFSRAELATAGCAQVLAALPELTGYLVGSA